MKVKLFFVIVISLFQIILQYNHSIQMDNPTGVASSDVVPGNVSLERLQTCWTNFSNSADLVQTVCVLKDNYLKQIMYCF